MINEDDRKKAFGKFVEARRMSKGWKQGELARRIGACERTIRRWEHGKTLPRLHHIKGLQRELGFTGEEIQDALGAHPQVRYSVCSQSQAAKICGSFEAYDDVRGRIINEFPLPEEPGEYGADEKWLSLLKMSPESGGAVVFQGDTIVGYWASLAVSENTYRAILDGKNVNKTLSGDDVIIPFVPGVYKMYFVDLFLLTAHANPTTRKLIVMNFLAFLLTSAEAGIFFERVAANITSIEMKRVCEHLGFKKVVDHQVHRFFNEKGDAVPAIIYELDIGTSADTLFKFDNIGLRQLYADKGSID